MAGLGLVLVLCGNRIVAQPLPGSDQALQIRVDSDGTYSLGLHGGDAIALRAGVAAEIDGRWLHASDYLQHAVVQSAVPAALEQSGPATDWKVTYSGAAGQPNLLYHLQCENSAPFCRITVTLRNTTAEVLHVGAIRSVDTSGSMQLNLGGPAADDRVLSDSWSEDRPAMTIHDLGDANRGMYRGVGSQLIYNRRSQQSLFLGALSSERFLTVLRLKLAEGSAAAPRIAGYEVESTGTTELQLENSLRNAPAQDRILLQLAVNPGAEVSSEPLLISLSHDYHTQLETYGTLIRTLHHARVSAPPLMGWWSWTAYYFGLNAGAALTNAHWEAEHLKQFGYDIFHIDEGYQYARGEYTTPNATLFPGGLAPVYYQIHGLGLVPGIWTAPFEVSERSWVYQKHPDWLVQNSQGHPVAIGTVTRHLDQLFVLDSTNPGAQQYLHETYSTMANLWGVRYFKLDFMDDSAIEGRYYKLGTTALEAQRIGLQNIRDAVGDGVFLDKDGSPMLNPVGLVDYGRISQDTGHAFDASKEAATGIAARYYMNRNYFVADPDAFTVSTQTIGDQAWHESRTPATLATAQVSIALAAVSGGMFEIGDDLPALTRQPERAHLLENHDLIGMIRLGKASVPLDLMSYPPEDKQPSLFLLKEDARQSILALFNWTESVRSHDIQLTSLRLPSAREYTVTDVFDGNTVPVVNRDGRVLDLQLPPHSVRILKIVDTAVQPVQPQVTAQHPTQGKTGVTLVFSADSTGADPVLSYHWDFGDGITQEGRSAQHTYTEPGEYSVRLNVEGLDGLSALQSFPVSITGHMSTTFDPASIHRPQ